MPFTYHEKPIMGRRMQLIGALNSVPEHIRIKYEFALLEQKPNEGACLDFAEGKLRVCFSNNWSDLELDFIQLMRDWHAGKGKPFSNLLRQASGKKSKTIVDLTCGLASDSILLLFYGHKVTAVERVPLMAALLENALERARQDEKFGSQFAKDFNLHYCSAQDFLGQTDLTDKTLYFDPMFGSHGGKKSLASKEMQFLAANAGIDEDYHEVFSQILSSGAKELIFKRPVKAPKLDVSPQEVILGKTVRFEKYTCKGRAFSSK